ncbi:class I SAM-dependent methyltransferase [Dongia soli]|uniref:Methyltransferase n=1 Tax=Dongia soli TaxID=600628 RepID=A0ABU5EID0_9PROT|nr:methyltransferase [Dongia soli]MDY0885245.1 methyltransferase [Dongia soli]
MRSGGSRLVLAVMLLAMPLLPACSSTSSDPDTASDIKLQSLIAGPQRSEKNTRRDVYRHPYETLTFFGLRDDMTVVEIDPGSGAWWTEILAPYLRDHGQYYAAGPAADDTSAEAVSNRGGFAAKLASNPALYDKVKVTEFAGDRHDIAPPGTADMVLTFRNLHNWIADGSAEANLNAFYRALKPGGILGIEDHRGRADQPQDPEAASGYVREDYAIALVEKAGFKFVAESEVNANPKDTKDYPAGVWTLPPTLRLKDKDRAKYLAIGESDRFTLKFVKPQ